MGSTSILYAGIRTYERPGQHLALASPATELGRLRYFNTRVSDTFLDGIQPAFGGYPYRLQCPWVIEHLICIKHLITRSFCFSWLPWYKNFNPYLQMQLSRSNLAVFFLHPLRDRTFPPLLFRLLLRYYILVKPADLFSSILRQPIRFN